MDALQLLGGDAGPLAKKLWELLAWQSRRYVSGESSSLPVETVEELLTSLCFTLGVWLDENHFSPMALADRDLQATLAEGNELVKALVGKAKARYMQARLTAVGEENQAYRDTLEGLDTFFRAYDWRYLAHQVPCTIDYPLCHPISEELGGVRYILAWLDAVCIENRFLRQFDRDELRGLWAAACPDYQDLLINLYEPAAVNALGITLLDKDPSGLHIAQGDQKELSELLQHAGCLETLLWDGARGTARRLGFASKDAAYLLETVRQLTPRLRAALGTGGDLGHIFLSIDGK